MDTPMDRRKFSKGDYVSHHPRYIEPGIGVLGKLQARIGRFAVLGNHDHWVSAPITRQALTEAGIELIDNAGVWIDRLGDRLRVCGVGDLRTDRQNSQAALGNATVHDAVICSWLFIGHTTEEQRR
jgi:uncharacterized protein